MNEKESLGSILIVAYNAEKFIFETVKSCLDQTYKNIQVLVLDNASQDNTLKILKSFTDERLIIFENEENVGPYRGLNFLLDRAQGKYVAIQDHDDIWFPRKIERQVEFLEKNQEFIACGTETFYFYEKREIFLLDRCEGPADFVNHTSLVFRNRGFRYNTEYVLADEYFEKKILRRSSDIFCIGEPLAIHRIRNDGNNLSHQRFRLNRKNLKEFFEINGFNLKSLAYVVSLVTVKYFPEKIIWQIIKIAKRKSQKINKEEFVLKYPEIKI